MHASTSSFVRDMLEEYGALAKKHLAQYLRSREPRQLYDVVADYPQRGGRMLRASLCIATARLYGATLDAILGSAASLEILHNAFLIHDDVEDEGQERRGRPTLHALHGIPIAVNAGDALTVLSLRPLVDNRHRLGPRLALRVLEEAERMARESVEGQAIELGWRRDNAMRLDDEDYLRMILKKTCWYTTIYPIRVGALIGTGDTAVLDRFLRFGFFLGAAFQIQDDLLNLTGDHTCYGKELNGDIWEGKRSLVLIRLLTQLSETELERASTIFATPRIERLSSDVVWIRERMDHYECISYARRVANGLAGAAQYEFSRAYHEVPPCRDRDFIEALPAWVLERT